MKKLLSLLTMAALTISILSLGVSTEENKDAKANYNGKTVSLSYLSDETKEWLQWYHSLSKDAQLMVSYEPSDLRKLVSTNQNKTILVEDVSSELIAKESVDSLS
ncbi:hypothetical protein [Clostridium minihomine]|uniref:hypothetical protein n=1 Tax=Clostridium minihomine TaxID=2045012 RepID=UPI00101AE95F|nr:hypothetical protein [Clostridium minihomine]